MAFSMFCFNVLHIYSSFKILDYVQCKVCLLWHLQLENWEVAIKKTLKLEMPCFDDLVLILIIVPRLNCNYNSHFLIAIIFSYFSLFRHINCFQFIQQKCLALSLQLNFCLFAPYFVSFCIQSPFWVCLLILSDLHTFVFYVNTYFSFAYPKFIAKTLGFKF